jgi:hypothetical protein
MGVAGLGEEGIATFEVLNGFPSVGGVVFRVVAGNSAVTKGMETERAA